MISTEFKFVLALTLVGAGYWISTLPEQYRDEGRTEERSKAKAASDDAVRRHEREFKDVETLLKTERENHAKTKIESDAKFNNYVADVRAGRVSGLRINRGSVCAAREEAARATGNEEETTVRLPREIEEGLFRFAHERDQIILDFEAFKQEVRIAKCFLE